MEAGTVSSPEPVARKTPSSIARRLQVPVDLGRFSACAVAEVPRTGRYASEVLRQTRLLIVGTTPLMLFLQALLGAVLGLFADYLLRTIGGVDYVGAVTSIGTGRGTVIVMTGYVLSAKVGCGLVAEIGSMRISEELDAFESVGLDPMRFVVATRLAAMWLYIPLIYLLSQVAAELGSYLAVVKDLGQVSSGTWASVHFSLRSVNDYLYSFIDCFTIATIIVVVAMYYGYRVRGGPAEVGQATARSMVVNLIAVHIVYAIADIVFYGSNPQLPFGG